MGLQFTAVGYSPNWDDDDDETPYVDLSLRNGVWLLRQLGLSTHAGIVSPYELVGRIELADPPDDGLPAERHGNYHEMGLPPGWFESRFYALRKLAEYAHANNTNVVWS